MLDDDKERKELKEEAHQWKPDKTLCKLAKKHNLKDHLDDYAALIKKPRYLCLKCGRVAHKKNNLCHPHPLK